MGIVPSRTRGADMRQPPRFHGPFCRSQGRSRTRAVQYERLAMIGEIFSVSLRFVAVGVLRTALRRQFGACFRSVLFASIEREAGWPVRLQRPRA